MSNNNNNIGDLHMVREIKTLENKVGADEARKFLEKIAKQVQPIMHKHRWRVIVLSEMDSPKNPGLLGVNYGYGLHVMLRLRQWKTDWDFYPFHQVLDTMLHELCHNVIRTHDVSFYKLWNHLRKECEELMIKENSGFGGFTRRFPHSYSHLQTTRVAAENRARQRAPLPSGPKRVAGTKRNRQSKNGNSGSNFVDLTDVPSVSKSPLPNNIAPDKKSRQKECFIDLTNDDPSITESNFVDLTDAPSVSKPSVKKPAAPNKNGGQKECYIDLTSNDPSTSGSTSNRNTGWPCRFCRLENTVKLGKCGACGNWNILIVDP